MVFSFIEEQIENLKLWKPALESEKARGWMREENKAEQQIKTILASSRFAKGTDLTPKQLDEYFSTLRYFSNNRSLTNLLYRLNGHKLFNKRLRNLLYGTNTTPLYGRINQMLQLEGIGEQTVTQFLMAFDSKKYPMVTTQTIGMLKLSASQEKQAQDDAISKFGIKNPEKLLPITLYVLGAYVVFEKIKNLLKLEKYSQVNNLLWFWREAALVSSSGAPISAQSSFSELLIDDERYKQKQFSKEEDFEAEITENSKIIFGKNSTYYPLKKKLGPRVCDALLYDRKMERVMIIENEIQAHDPYEHILPQIIDFFNAIKEKDTKNHLKHDIAWLEDEKNNIVRAIDLDQYDVLVNIDIADFDTKQAAKNMSTILRELVTEKSNQSIKFKEISVYETKHGKKIFRIRNL